MILIDSHAHLTDERLLPDLDDVLARARAAGVEAIVTIGTNAETSRAAVEMAAERPGVYATVGVHPHSADEADDAAFEVVRELAAHPKVVGLGETGLDFYYDNAARDAQQRSFERHLEMGRELDLPLVVHARSADAEIAATLRSAGQGTRGVLHCFAAGRALLDAAFELDWYVSFSGLITFRNYADTELLRAVPDDRVLVETDSPYLAPVPYRGKRNEPAYVGAVLQRAAEIRDVAPEQLAAATVRNACALYRLPRT